MSAHRNRSGQGVPRATGPCGKVGYLTRPAARVAARKLASSAPGKRLRVYRCGDERCGGLPWHLTASLERG